RYRIQTYRSSVAASGTTHLDYSNPFGMLALAKAVPRAFIHPSRKAFSSEGGLPLLYSAQAEASTSCRLKSALLWASCSADQWPASFNAFTAPGCTGTTQFLV